MKLFPEQNGNLMNTLHNPSSLQPTLQQAAAIIPTLTSNTNSMEPVSNINPVSSAALSSLVVNNSSNYPLEMECDPVSSASLPSSSSSSALNSTTNPALQNSRYNFLLSGLSTSASSGALLNGANPTNTIGGGTVGPLSGNHAHLHRNSKSASNVLQNFAPTSLPIGLYSGMSNNGAVNNDTHSLAAYQHHLLASGVGPNGNIAYIPYSMSSSETVPKTNSTMTSSSSLSSS